MKMSSQADQETAYGEHCVGIYISYHTDFKTCNAKPFQTFAIELKTCFQ